MLLEETGNKQTYKWKKNPKQPYNKKQKKTETTKCYVIG